MDDETRERIEKEKSICSDYSITFEGKEGGTVLEDLKDFCGADKVCFAPDARVEAFGLGARSVWLYIQERISGASLKRMSIPSENDITAKSTTSP